MASIFKTISTEIKKRYLYIKFFRYGRSDVQEVRQVLPYGIDSNPIEGMTGLYSKTGENGKAVVVGYIQESLAEIGELRFKSTNSSGVEQTYMLFKNDGNIELNGSVKNLTRYQDLNTGLGNYSVDLGVELAKIAAVLNSLVPGSYTPVNPTFNISAAKIDNIKTN